VSAAGLLIGYTKVDHFSVFLGSRPKLAATGVSSLTTPYSLKTKNKEWTWKGEKCVFSDNSQVKEPISIENCTIGDFREAGKRILLIGDSFTAAFTHGFDQLVQKRNYSVTITSSFQSSPIKEIPNKSALSKANDFYWNSTVPSLIKELRAGDIVFLINNLHEFSPKKKTSQNTRQLQLLEKGLVRFSNELKSKGIALAILNANPSASEAGCFPAITVNQWYSPVRNEKCKIPDRKTTLDRRKNLDKVLKRVSTSSGLTVIDLLGVFCPLEKCTYYARDGSILYRDEYWHPSVEAAQLSGDVFFKQFADRQ